MTHQAIRRMILEALYRHQEGAPRSYGLTETQLQQRCGHAVDFDVEYLRSKGWIERQGVYVRLTAAGIDEAEREGGGI